MRLVVGEPVHGRVTLAMQAVLDHKNDRVRLVVKDQRRRAQVLKDCPPLQGKVITLFDLRHGYARGSKKPTLVIENMHLMMQDLFEGCAVDMISMGADAVDFWTCNGPRRYGWGGS